MDENKQAILLLSAHFSAPVKGAPTPLTALEYGRLAVWMKENGYTPKDLFHRLDDLLGQWSDPKRKVTDERVRYLLGRGLAMGLAIEKWNSAGIWVLARSDSEYPQRLKRRLGHAAPAVLFGVGSKALLSSGGLAVVGSRNIGDAESNFTQVVAKQAAAEGLNVVSGGARGVDETSMLAALEAEGTALGVVANDLFKSALSGKWRKHLKSEQLSLVSPFYPEARFQVGSAMGRNKYIYCLAESALVVRSEEGSGGTWAGAVENNKNTWVPLFVASPSEAEGNSALLNMGARPLVLGATTVLPKKNWLRSQLEVLEVALQAEVGLQKSVVDEPRVLKEANKVASLNFDDKPPSELMSYKEFLIAVSEFLSDKGEVHLGEINTKFAELPKVHVREWIDQAVDEGVLFRPGRALKFSVDEEGGKQARLV